MRVGTAVPLAAFGNPAADSAVWAQECGQDGIDVVRVDVEEDQFPHRLQDLQTIVHGFKKSGIDIVIGLTGFGGRLGRSKDVDDQDFGENRHYAQGKTGLGLGSIKQSDGSDPNLTELTLNARQNRRRRRSSFNATLPKAAQALNDAPKPLSQSHLFEGADKSSVSLAGMHSGMSSTGTPSQRIHFSPSNLSSPFMARFPWCCERGHGGVWKPRVCARQALWIDYFCAIFSAIGAIQNLSGIAIIEPQFSHCRCLLCRATAEANQSSLSKNALRGPIEGPGHLHHNGKNNFDDEQLHMKAKYLGHTPGSSDDDSDNDLDPTFYTGPSRAAWVETCVDSTLSMLCAAISAFKASQLAHKSWPSSHGSNAVPNVTLFMAKSDCEGLLQPPNEVLMERLKDVDEFVLPAPDSILSHEKQDMLKSPHHSSADSPSDCMDTMQMPVGRHMTRARIGQSLRPSSVECPHDIVMFQPKRLSAWLNQSDLKQLAKLAEREEKPRHIGLSFACGRKGKLIWNDVPWNQHSSRGIAHNNLLSADALHSSDVPQAEDLLREITLLSKEVSRQRGQKFKRGLGGQKETHASKRSSKLRMTGNAAANMAASKAMNKQELSSNISKDAVLSRDMICIALGRLGYQANDCMQKQSRHPTGTLSNTKNDRSSQFLDDGMLEMLEGDKYGRDLATRLRALGLSAPLASVYSFGTNTAWIGSLRAGCFAYANSFKMVPSSFSRTFGRVPCLCKVVNTVESIAKTENTLDTYHALLSAVAKFNRPKMAGHLQDQAVSEKEVKNAGEMLSKGLLVLPEDLVEEFDSPKYLCRFVASLISADESKILKPRPRIKGQADTRHVVIDIEPVVKTEGKDSSAALASSVSDWLSGFAKPSTDGAGTEKKPPESSDSSSAATDDRSALTDISDSDDFSDVSSSSDSNASKSFPRRVQGKKDPHDGTDGPEDGEEMEINDDDFEADPPDSMKGILCCKRAESRVKYVACMHTWEEFEANEGNPNKYNDTNARCRASKRAHQDFWEQLRLINQLEPLGLGADADWVKERSSVEEKNLRTSNGFKRHLVHRKRMSGKKFSGRKALRKGTVELLIRPPEEDFNMVMLFAQIAAMASLGYNVFVQGQSSYQSLLNREWILPLFFLYKEIFFISYPCTKVISGVILPIFMAPFAIIYFISRIFMRDYTRKASMRTIKYLVLPVINENVSVLVNMTLSLSSLYRIVQLTNQIWQRELNPSIKDFDAKLSSVGNLMFTIVLILIKPQSATLQVQLSLLLSMLMLLRQMVTEKMLLKEHYQAIKDLNENRLTKFEMSLWMFKLMEFFLSDDVTSNFTEHFYTRERFRAGFRRYHAGSSKSDDEEMEYQIALEKELARKRTLERQKTLAKAAKKSSKNKATDSDSDSD